MSKVPDYNGAKLRDERLELDTAMDVLSGHLRFGVPERAVLDSAMRRVEAAIRLLRLAVDRAGGSPPDIAANGLAGWPDSWPDYFNGGSTPCDVAIGPCACGAWHQAGEFEMRASGLYRYGRLVARPLCPAADGGEGGGGA